MDQIQVKKMLLLIVDDIPPSIDVSLEKVTMQVAHDSGHKRVHEDAGANLVQSPTEMSALNILVTVTDSLRQEDVCHVYKVYFVQPHRP